MKIDKENKEICLKSNSRYTKIVIRHLPPSLTSEKFLEQISPIPDHNYYYFVKGDPTLGAFSYSRAYINFLNQEDILIFKEKFDNYVFLGDNGNEYCAIVEFSVFQGFFKQKKKIDYRCDTIEQDHNFIKFVSNNQNNKHDINLPTVEDCLEEIEAKEKEQKSIQMVSTPLLEYLKQNKIVKCKFREEKLREDRLEKKKKDEASIKKKSYIKIKQRNKEWSDVILKKEKDSQKKHGKKRPNYKDSLKQNGLFNKINNLDKKNDCKFKNLSESSESKEIKNIKSELSYSHLKRDKYKCDRQIDEGSTFTVKFFTHQHQENLEKKINKTNENNKEKTEDKKIKNKDRPSIEIYRPKKQVFQKR